MDCIDLMDSAKFVFTDSGGLQEESCILKTPCSTFRENTERPETVQVGSNRLVGSSYSKLVDAIRFFSKSSKEWKNPFGDGNSANIILDFILR